MNQVFIIPATGSMSLKLVFPTQINVLELFKSLTKEQQIIMWLFVWFPGLL